MIPVTASSSTSDTSLENDEFHEECGVFGIWAPQLEVARLTYFGLQALQHRGQESAGIAVGDGATVLVRKDLGLVNQVFTDADLCALPGKVAIGHVRYGTAGSKGWESAQPHLSAINDVIIALAHNGTLVNFDELRVELINMGVTFRSSTDSEVAARLIGFFTEKKHRLRSGITHAMAMMRGGYAMALVRENALYAFRDPRGIRPLCLGTLPDDQGLVVASETCALDIVGARYIRDVRPGEIIRISDEGLSSEQALPPESSAECIFEDVYFARPDSRFHGRSVYSMRYAMGEQLAREAPADVDLVIGVPDSGLPPAEGFAHELGLPFGEGLIKNRYIARTFIQPTQELREMGVRLKLNALVDTVANKRLVVVDDSIVRGTTSQQIVRMLKDTGAREVHLRINSPEVAWPCFYGIDTGEQSQLISARKNVDEVCSSVGADSLAFLSPEGLEACVPDVLHSAHTPQGDSCAVASSCGGYCTACFSGIYPVELPESLMRTSFIKGNCPVSPWKESHE